MIRRKDLVDIADKDYKQRQDEFMQCQDCEEEFGGTRGDFFMITMDDIFYCPECGSESIALVKKACKNVVVKQ